MAYVNLSKMPSAKKEYVASFQNLNGGLNLQELDYRIQNDESPEMKNLWWENGVLGSRNGQVWVDSSDGEEFHAAYERLWNGKMFTHSGTQIFIVDPKTGDREAIYTGNYDFDVRGVFFPYNGKLYYKTKGYYVEIEYEPGMENDTGLFSAGDVEPYTPVTYINCSPLNGSGDPYQPENRISAEKTLWYNALQTLTVTSSQVDLSVVAEDAYFRMRINTPGSYVFEYDGSVWSIDGVEVNLLDFGITVGGTPVNGATITATLVFANEYWLPLGIEELVRVEVDNAVWTLEELHSEAGRDTITYSIDQAVWREKVKNDYEEADPDDDLEHQEVTYEFVYNYEALPSETWELNGEAVDITEYGITVTADPPLHQDDTITVEYLRGDYWTDGRKVIFYHAPPVTYPETNNTVHVTYKKYNEVAYNNIMDCTIVKTYGGTGSLCIVMAGSETQPNAYFWNGQNSVAMDATYFPMTQYQLAGDVSDPVRGFGIQQGFLIILKEGSVGRTTLSTAEVDGRLAIELPYVNINDKMGCDLPYSIQLIENNLTWCNTSDGVVFLANTSSAYENNVVCISDKVNYSSQTWSLGLLNDIRQNDKLTITSHDDDKRYWLVIGNHVWLWDYFVSNYKNPSWFYFTDIPARQLVQEDGEVWHFNENSRLTHFERVFYDYDSQFGGIDKVYRFATQFFGTYDNKKNINSVIINTRSDTNSVIRVWWMSDYETREDLTPLGASAWRLVPRDLSFRNLKGSGFAHVFRRKPHCRRVQYFTMRLANNTAYMDMTIVSAQIYYVFEGRQR